MKKKGNLKKVLAFGVSCAMTFSMLTIPAIAGESDEENAKAFAEEETYGGTIIVPEGIADGVYSGSATVESTGSWSSYSITVSVTVSNSEITEIAVEGAEGRNANYTENARAGIESQILSGMTDIDAVSGATCSSAAIIAAVNDALESAEAEEPDDGTTSITLSTSTPVYNVDGTSFDVVITNPQEDTDYSEIVLSYEAGRNTGTLEYGSDYTVSGPEESSGKSVYTVTVINGEYNQVGWSLNVAVAGEDLGSITIVSGAIFSIVDNTLVMSGGNGETLADFINNASSITLVYTDRSGEEVTVTESLQPFHSEAPNYYGSDIFNEDGSINFSCSIFANGASGIYQMTVTSDGFNDVSATVGDTYVPYTITIPEGLADGTYTASGIYVDHDNDKEDAEAFTNYPISVDVVIEDGKIVSITVSGAEGNNTQYSYRAETGISEQIVGSSAGTYDIDTVSSATCSSVAIIEAVNAALQNEASNIRMSLSDAIYHKEGTSFTITITNPDPSVDYSDIGLSYAVGKFANALEPGEDFTVSDVVELDDGSLEYTVTILNSMFNVNDDDHDTDDENYNTVGMAIDVQIGETTVGRVIITSAASLEIKNNTLTLTGGYGETLEDFLDLAGELTLTYENEDGETVTDSYTLQWAHDVDPDYTAHDFFYEDGSVNFDIAPFVYGADGIYIITVTAEGFPEVTGVVGAVSEEGEPEPASPVDKNNLLDAYVEGMKLTESDYTTDSWEALEAALEAARAVLLDADATQDDVEAAEAALKDAMDNLEPTAEIKDGLIKDSDGVWRLYENNVFCRDYNGFAENANGKWYVEFGVVTFAKTDILKDKTGAIGDAGDWYYVIDSKVQTNYTGLSNFSNINGWWYIAGGKVDFTHNGVDKNVNGWWYVTGGKVRFGFTGLANYKNENGWWYIKDGKVDFTHNGVDKNVNGWWYVTGGKVQFGFTGLANYRNENGWWYIKNGKVDFTYNGRAQNKNGWWNVVNGKVQF